MLMLSLDLFAIVVFEGAFHDFLEAVFFFFEKGKYYAMLLTLGSWILPTLMMSYLKSYVHYWVETIQT